MILSNPAFHLLYLSVMAPTQPPKKNVSIALPESNSLEMRTAYNYEQTFVIRDYLGADLKRCVFVEAYTEEDQADVREFLDKNFITLLHVTMEGIKYVMDECDAIDTEKDEQLASGHIVAILNNPAIHGIVPNTKWCGSGNIAAAYNDLGPSPNIDKCCRSHDFCPIKIQSKSRRYGLKNTGSTTRSHCECDKYFHDCLVKHMNESTVASFIGNMFFNVLRPYCIQGLPEQQKLEFSYSPKTWGYVKTFADYFGYRRR